jgi:hypothetical protein
MRLVAAHGFPGLCFIFPGLSHPPGKCRTKWIFHTSGVSAEKSVNNNEIYTPLMRRQSFHIGILSQPFDVRRQLLPRWLAVDPGGIQRRMPQKRRQHDDVCKMLGQIIVGEGMPKRRRLLKESTKGGVGVL